MNVALILEDARKMDISKLKFGKPSTCFLGLLLGEEKEAMVSFYDWAIRPDYHTRMMMFKVVRDNINKYQLSHKDLINISNVFEISEENDPKLLHKAYLETIHYLESKL